MNSEKKFDFNKLIYDEYRHRIQMIVIPLIFGLVSFGMFILNIFTHKTMLMYATLFFSVASLFISVIFYFSRKSLRIPYLLFEIDITALFVYFLVFGGTEGFSPMWICILPACGPMLLGKKRGAVMTIIMFFITAFLLWIPLGQSLLQYDFTSSFKTRFPIVYLSFGIVGYFFECIREMTYNQLVQLQNKYKEISIKDALTGVYNRYWFNEVMTRDLAADKHESVALMIIDVDKFKMFNDNYGHLFGDEILKTVAQTISRKTEGYGNLCRWGGEEFAVYMGGCNCETMKKRAEEIRRAVADIKIEGYDKLSIHVSIGAVFMSDRDAVTPELLVSYADEAMYSAKDSGRNCVVSCEK